VSCAAAAALSRAAPGRLALQGPVG
jgi:hypothetical protein